MIWVMTGDIAEWIGLWLFQNDVEMIGVSGEGSRRGIGALM
jgi:hypothetical protein